VLLAAAILLPVCYDCHRAAATAAATAALLPLPPSLRKAAAATTLPPLCPPRCRQAATATAKLSPMPMPRQGRILRCAHEEWAMAYSMYLPESNVPSEEKQLKILAFAVGVEG
jgi:hypothetical protein